MGLPDNLRACLAALAVQMVAGGTVSSVWDHTRAKRVFVSGTVIGSSVDMYDHERNSQLRGSLPTLHDEQLDCDITVEVNRDMITGTDHGTGTSFSGQVVGRSVLMVDGGSTRQHHFSA